MKLIVIDMQKTLLVDDLYDLKGLSNKVAKLIKTARDSGVEVIFVKHDAGQGSGFSNGDEGFEIPRRFKPLDNEKVFVKTINSSFGNKDFEQYLKQANDKELMIVGLQTEFCIDATIKSAFEKGYQVYVPRGTNSTFDNDYLDASKTVKYYNEWIWDDVFAKCLTFNKSLDLLKTK